MPRTNEMIPSKFLKGADVGDGKLVTIGNVTRENVGTEEEPEAKWAVHFKEFAKPLVLNKTNINRLERMCSSDNTDDWAGKQCVVYFDPDVEFGGKTVGGLRVRSPKKESDLPF